MARGSQWLRTVTRWAIYARDGFACVYCGVGLEALVEDGDGNHLTVDHVLASCNGGTNEPGNLVTACYACNAAKGRLSLRAYCAEDVLSYGAVRARVWRRTRRGLSAYRGMARALLGLAGPFPARDLVVRHDWLVRSRWFGELDAAEWDHLQGQAVLWCEACQRPTETAEAVPF